MAISPIQLYNVVITKSDYTTVEYAVETANNTLAALQLLIQNNLLPTDLLGFTITTFNTNLVS